MTTLQLFGEINNVLELGKVLHDNSDSCAIRVANKPFTLVINLSEEDSKPVMSITIIKTTGDMAYGTAMKLIESFDLQDPQSIENIRNILKVIK